MSSYMRNLAEKSLNTQVIKNKRFRLNNLGEGLIAGVA